MRMKYATSITTVSVCMARRHSRRHAGCYCRNRSSILFVIHCVLFETGNDGDGVNIEADNGEEEHGSRFSFYTDNIYDAYRNCAAGMAPFIAQATGLI